MSASQMGTDMQSIAHAEALRHEAEDEDDSNPV